MLYGSVGRVGLRSSVAPFSPSALFAAGEVGGWYDPSDLSTLFQDAAGTTPVTAVEQPVGLILDKSKGLALGSELVTNGTFDTNLSGWAAGGNWSWVSGRAYHNGSTFSTLQQSGISRDVAKKLTFSAEVVAGTFSVEVADASAVNTTFILFTGSTSGTTSAIIPAGYDILRFYRASGSPCQFYIDNVSAASIAGNHARQSTSTARPVLSARVNLLTRTEEFDNAAWIKEGTLTTTARSISFPSSATDRLMQSATTQAVPTNLTIRIPFSVADAGKKIRFGIWASGLDGMSSGLSADITIPSDGIVTYTRNNVTSLSLIGIINGSAGTSQTITLASNGGIDLRVSNDGTGLPAYQRVNTSTDYDTAGFPMYLRFDGTDDSLATGSIDFTGTDKMTVWAGIRKTSDASYGALVELSANINSNAGVFNLFAPATPDGYTYTFASRGSNAPVVTGPTTGYPAPITNVLTGIADISGDRVTLRANSTQVAQSTADQGTGNYGNYPAYIGRRGGSTFSYNGRLYSLIVRGAASTDAQIAATETWVNGKTKAY